MGFPELIRETGVLKAYSPNLVYPAGIPPKSLLEQMVSYLTECPLD